MTIRYPTKCRCLYEALAKIAEGAKYTIDEGYTEAHHRVSVETEDYMWVFQAEKMHYHDEDEDAENLKKITEYGV
jgi:hypothetical protein